MPTTLRYYIMRLIHVVLMCLNWDTFEYLLLNAAVSLFSTYIIVSRYRCDNGKKAFLKYCFCQFDFTSTHSKCEHWPADERLHFRYNIIAVFTYNEDTRVRSYNNIRRTLFFVYFFIKNSMEKQSSLCARASARPTKHRSFFFFYTAAAAASYLLRQSKTTSSRS